jgi:hypothetical protein
MCNFLIAIEFPLEILQPGPPNQPLHNRKQFLKLGLLIHPYPEGLPEIGVGGLQRKTRLFLILTPPGQKLMQIQIDATVPHNAHLQGFTVDLDLVRFPGVTEGALPDQHVEQIGGLLRDSQLIFFVCVVGLEVLDVLLQHLSLLGLRQGGEGAGEVRVHVDLFVGGAHYETSILVCFNGLLHEFQKLLHLYWQGVLAL